VPLHLVAYGPLFCNGVLVNERSALSETGGGACVSGRGSDDGPAAALAVVLMDARRGCDT
jgi:hypothetical protein